MACAASIGIGRGEIWLICICMQDAATQVVQHRLSTSQPEAVAECFKSLRFLSQRLSQTTHDDPQ